MCGQDMDFYEEETGCAGAASVSPWSDAGDRELCGGSATCLL